MFLSIVGVIVILLAFVVCMMPGLCVVGGGLLIRLAKRTPYTHLRHEDGSLYMERFWLLKPRGESGWGWGVRIHHIVTSDLDRDLHDHPGGFLSIVLKGGYYEERPIDNACHWKDWSVSEPLVTTWRGVGSMAFRSATDRHRITELARLNETWTLVVTGPKRHWWGFYTPVGKIHWRDYPTKHEKRGV